MKLKKIKLFKNRRLDSPLSTSVLSLLLCILVSSQAFAGIITHYRMDNLVLPSLGSFFTFSVDDLNGDRIGSYDEIRDFSGLACLAVTCPFANFTTLGKVDIDITFGGSGEAFFDLDTLNWTYNIINGTVDYSSGSPIQVPPYNTTLGADFGMSSLVDIGNNTMALVGTPLRLFAPNGGQQLWSVAQVPEPSTLAILAFGLMGLASRRFKKQS